MRQGVHADRRGQGWRQADGQGRIGDHQPGQHERMEDHPLDHRLLILDHAGAADFRPGAGGGRDGDDRQDPGRIGPLEVVADVFEVP